MKSSFFFLTFILFLGSAHAETSASKCGSILAEKLKILNSDSLLAEVESLKEDIALADKIRELKKNVKDNKELLPELRKAQAKLENADHHYIHTTHKLFEQQGIPSSIVKEGDITFLEINLSAPSTGNEVFKFLQKVHDKFEIKRITIRLKDNVDKNRKGFSREKDGLIEIGYYEPLNSIQGVVGGTLKHEVRHAIFKQGIRRKKPSVYQIKFYKSKSGNKLSSNGSYEKFMTAEEVYNWSTDFETIAQSLKKADNVEPILAKAITKNADFMKILDNTLQLTEDMQAALRNMQTKNNFRSMKLKNSILHFSDHLGRKTRISLTGEKERVLYEKILEASENFKKEADSYAKTKLDKAKLPESHASYEAEKLKYIKSFRSTTSAKELRKSINAAKSEMAEVSIKKLQDLKLIAKVQRENAEILKNLLDSQDINLESIKRQMFSMGKKVKENYKGFALNDID